MHEAPVRGVRYHAASQWVNMGADLKERKIKIMIKQGSKYVVFLPCSQIASLNAT